MRRPLAAAGRHYKTAYIRFEMKLTQQPAKSLLGVHNAGFALGTSDPGYRDLVV